MRRNARAQRNIAVFCSGRGTNLAAILQAIRRRRLRARVAVVVSDRPGAGALLKARRAGVAAQVLERTRFASRQAFEQALSRTVDRAGARLIVLAGFMRILSPWFVRRYAGRILNIHPSLLPAFPGAHGVREALRYGVKVTGVTIHFANEKVDGGPILLQEPLVIRPGELESQLLARLHRIEHRLYPRAIQLVLDGKVRVKGRNVRIMNR